MSTSDKAVLKIKSDLVNGINTVSLVMSVIEKTVNKIVSEKFQQANFDSQGKLKRQVMNANGYSYSSVRTSFGNYTGFSVFVDFSYGVNDKRNLQVCFGMPVTEYPKEIVVNESDLDSTIILSLGDWGNSVEILNKLASALADKTYYLVPEHSEIRLCHV